MNILFIRLFYYTEESHPENIRPPLDIGYSISLLEEKHGTNLNMHLIDTKLENYSDNDLITIAKRKKIDTIFIKCQTHAVNRAKQISRKFKDNASVKGIILLGQHPTISPDTFLSKDSVIDFCVRGEPEESILKLVENDLKIGNIDELDGLAYYDDNTNQVVSGKIKIVKDLDSLPQPKHEHFLDDNYGDVLPMQIKGKRKKYGYILTSRGCPYQCIYCSPTLRVTYGKNMRFRDPENVVDEIEYLLNEGVNVIVFKDDIFTVSENHVIGICKEIIRRGLDINWFAQTRADCLTEKMVYYMKKSGCQTVGIGVESASERILDTLKKDETKEEVREAFRILKKYNLYIVGFFMLNCPSETKLDVLKNIKFCEELSPDMIQVAFLTPYPGSSVYNEIYGRELEYERFLHYNDLPYNCSNLSDEELFQFQKLFYRRFYMSWDFIKSFFKRNVKNLPYSLYQNYVFIKKGLKFLYKKS